MSWNTTPIVLPINPSDLNSGCSTIRREVDQIWFYAMELANKEGADFNKDDSVAYLPKHIHTLLRNVHILEDYADEINERLLNAENPAREVQR